MNQELVPTVLSTCSAKLERAEKLQKGVATPKSACSGSELEKLNSKALSLPLSLSPELDQLTAVQGIRSSQHLHLLFSTNLRKVCRRWIGHPVPTPCRRSSRPRALRSRDRWTSSPFRTTTAGPPQVSPLYLDRHALPRGSGLLHTEGIQTDRQTFVANATRTSYATTRGR